MGSKVERRSKRQVYRSGGGFERGVSGLVGVSIVGFVLVDGSSYHLIRNAAGPQAAATVAVILIAIAVVSLLLAAFGWRGRRSDD